MQEDSNNCISVPAWQTSILYFFHICLYLHENYNKPLTITYVFLFRCPFALANSSSTFKFYLNKSGETRTPTDVKQHGSGRLQFAQLYTPPRRKKMLMSVAALYTWQKNEWRENSVIELGMYSKSSTVTPLGRRTRKYSS